MLPQGRGTAKPEVAPLLPLFNLGRGRYRHLVRKKRSSQKAPGSASLRLHLIWAGPLLLIAIALIAGTTALQRWLSSNECRSLVERKSSEALHAEAAVEPLRWGWFSLSTEGFKATGTGTNSLRQLEAGGIRGRIQPGALLRGVWLVEEVSLEKLHLHIGSGSGNGQESPAAEAGENVPSAVESGKLPKWVPTLLEIKAIRSQKSDLVMDLPTGKTMELLGTRLAAYPEGKETRLEATGGILHTPILPDLELRTARARMLEGKRVRLNGADFAFPRGGTIRAEGEFPDESGSSSLHATWEKIPVTGFIPALEGKVTGSFEGEATFLWKGNAPVIIQGKNRATGVTLEGLPQLDQLAAFTGMNQFRSFPVQDASASFYHDGQTTRWTDVVLESRGLLKMVGEATVGPGESLSGSFQLGITTAVVRVLPMVSQLLGAEERDGYLWMPMKVGGTLSHPTDDLSPRLVMAVAAKAAGEVRKGLDEGMKLLGIKPAATTPPGTGTTNAPAGTQGTPGTPTNPATPPASPGLLPSAATNAVKTIEQGAGAAMDVLGGFLK